MTEVWTILVYTTAAGATIPLGGALAGIERVRPQWLEREFRHGVFAFGGGILLAAVALVLVPEGIRSIPVSVAVISILAGGLLFLFVDRSLAQRGTPASFLLATFLDFAPEAMALGATIQARPSVAALLALLIALQNFPEGFNAYRELLVRSHLSRTRILGILGSFVAVGPLCGMLGLWVLSEAALAAGITMLFASGGILYLTFQDIAPQARLERHWGPPLGAVLGFSLGLAAHMVLRT